MADSYRLIVHALGAEGRERIFDLAADMVRIGRDEDVQVRLPHACVSKLHLHLERRDGRVFAVDHGSTNGTSVRGEHLVPNVPHPLADGDVIEVGGRFEIAFYARSPGDALVTGPKVTADIARRLVDDLLATGGRRELGDVAAGPHLSGQSGAAGGLTHRLPAPDSRTLVGRGAGCDIVLIDPDLSREHYEIRRTWNGITVTDLLSKNGTFLNGHRLAADEATLLVDGDEVKAGACAFTLVDPAARYLAQLSELVVDAPPPAIIVEEHDEDDDDEGVDGADPDDGPNSWKGTVRPPSEIDREPASDGVPVPAPAAGSSVVPMLVIGAVVLAAAAALAYLLLA